MGYFLHAKFGGQFLSNRLSASVKTIKKNIRIKTRSSDSKLDSTKPAKYANVQRFHPKSHNRISQFVKLRELQGIFIITDLGSKQ